MPRYHVFLGAPKASGVSAEDVSNTFSKWETIETALSPDAESQQNQLFELEEASRRISKLYENVIFREDSEEYLSDEPDYLGAVDHTTGLEQTVLVTWDPTRNDDEELSVPLALGKPEGTFFRTTASISRLQAETQETQETRSYDYSDASSIARFPSFHFNLHILTSLSSQKYPGSEHALEYPCGRSSLLNAKVNVLAAVLEVEGPDTIRLKRGRDAGKETSILKLIIADEDGTVCKLVAWSSTAERWGGSFATEDGVKRGDVVLFQNVKLSLPPASTEPSDGPTLTASPCLSSSLQICFRTMPLGGDARYRPDLRLGFSDPSVRKVAAIVTWFENIAGLPNSEQVRP